MGITNNYLKRFPYSEKEKSNRPKKKATSEGLEKFLFEFESLLESLADDAITSDGNSFMEDICKEYEHCRSCYGKFVESYEFDNLVRTCSCFKKYKIITKENYI